MLSAARPAAAAAAFGLQRLLVVQLREDVLDRALRVDDLCNDDNKDTDSQNGRKRSVRRASERTEDSGEAVAAGPKRSSRQTPRTDRAGSDRNRHREERQTSLEAFG